VQDFLAVAGEFYGLYCHGLWVSLLHPASSAGHNVDKVLGNLESINLDPPTLTITRPTVGFTIFPSFVALVLNKLYVDKYQ
jgi:hypothetical protein